MDYYETLINSKTKRMNLEDLVSITKKIPKSDNKFLAKSMIECMARMKFDKRINITYEMENSVTKTVVFVCE